MKAQASQSSDPFIAAFGNPLLDVCVTIDDNEILNKYGLPIDGQTEITEQKLRLLLAEIRKRYFPVFSPGGAAQNTLRVFQWLIREPFKSVFFGCVGCDDLVVYLESQLKKAGVSPSYCNTTCNSTGTCISLIHGEHRSLAAHIGAATKYNSSALNDQVNWHLDRITLLYIEGFFLTHSFPVCVRLAEACKEKKIPLIFNLSAAYVCESYLHEVTEVVKSANIVFGNSDEFFSLANQLNIENSSLKDVVVKLKENFHNSLSESRLQHCELSQILKEGKLIIATQGKNAVICVYGKENTVLEEKVGEMDVSQIKDTTGAGDAFVAGVLAGIFHDCSLKNCIHLGCWAAQQIIKQIGCKLPSHPPDDEEMFIEK